MSDDRDKRKPFTPPGGVRSQIAPPLESGRGRKDQPPHESWEDQVSLTPIHPTPIPRMAPSPVAIPRTLTPQESSVVVEGIDRRVRETKNTTLTTLDRVERLRDETRTEITRIHDKMDAQGTKIDAVIMVVADMGREVGAQGGQNDIIIKMLEDEREVRSRVEHVITTTRIAEVEVDKTRQIADINDTQDKRKFRRQVLLKVLAAVGALWAVVSTVLLTRC